MHEHEGRLPTGTVTFLFTDIESSTRMWEDRPADMEGALERHDALLGGVITRHDGVVLKHTGDGTLAVFRAAVDALAAAVETQRTIGDEDWGATPIKVRMALHTGEAQERDGDYFGTTLNRTARLLGTAWGGQIVVSATTADVARDRLPDGVRLVDLGEHRLRDVRRPERIFQVAAPGLPDDFPELRTRSAVPSNLPEEVSSFVGRGEEIHRAEALLDEARVLTILGPGGIGKTRFALRLAREARGRFPDGAWLCDLSAVTDPDAVPDVVASVLGLQPEGARSILEALLGALATRRSLLLFDNCEHVVDPVRLLVDRISRSCPEVLVLATSRESLRIEAERVFELGTLSAEGPDGPAVRLFVERAQAIRGDVEFDADDLEAIRDICRRLDGLPLAIELAAARTNTMDPVDIARRLGERFRLLRDDRVLAGRQRGLKETVDWSHELLSPTERAVFRRASVFAGTFDLDAAEVICEGDDADAADIASIAATLVERSMIRRERTGLGARFRMLETLRAYGNEQLEAAGEAEDVRRRHATHYAAMAEELGVVREGPREVEAIDRLEAELDNFRAAHRWALDVRDPDVAFRLVVSLHFFAYFGMRIELFRWAEEAARAFGASDHPLREEAFGTAAVGALQRGDLEAVVELAERGMELAEAAGRPTPMNAVQALCQHAMHAGNVEAVMSHIDRMEEDHPEGYATEMWRIGREILRVYSGSGDEDLVAATERHVEDARREGNPTMLTWALYAYGEALSSADPDRAIDVMQEVLELAPIVRNRLQYGASSLTLVSLAGRHGEPSEALRAFDEVIDHWASQGAWVHQWTTLRNLVELFTRMAMHAEAITLLEAGEASDLAPPSFGEQGRRLDVVRERAREILGAEAYEAAARRGRGMSDEDALRFARETIRAASV